MEKLVSNIGSKLVLQKIILPEKVDEFSYGLDLLLFTLISKASVITLGVMLGCFVETVLYTFSFSILQSLGGGFHAKSHLRCFITTLLGWATAMALVRLMPFAMAAVLLIAGIVSVFRLSPVENENAPMSESKKVRMGQYTRIACVILAAITVALYAITPTLSYAMVASIALSGFSKLSASILR